MLLDGLSMAAKGLTSVDELRALGSFYLPPPSTQAAKLLEEALSSTSALFEGSL